MIGVYYYWLDISLPVIESCPFMRIELFLGKGETLHVFGFLTLQHLTICLEAWERRM